MAKIIKKDNFDREHVDDKLIAENVHEYYIDDIVNMLNEKYSGDHAPDFYVKVPDDYVLYTFEP